MPTQSIDREIILTNEDVKIALQAIPTKKYHKLIQTRGHEPIKHSIKTRPSWMLGDKTHDK